MRDGGTVLHRSGLPERRWQSPAWQRRLALAWALGAIVVLVLGAWWRGIPQSDEAGFWERSAQALLLVVYLVGWLLAARGRLAAGATVLALSGTLIGALSAIQYHPVEAFLVAALLVAPSVLLWWVWQRAATARHVVALGLAMVVLVVGGGTGAYALYLRFQAHTPQSSLQALPVTSVRWMWSGAVTPTSATVVARLADRDATPRLLLGTSADLLGDDRRLAATHVDTRTGVARFELAELTPGTAYWYAIEADGTTDLRRTGRFRTPATGAHSFTFAFASCARLGTNAKVFETIAAADPDFFLLTGDAFYGNIGVNDTDVFLRHYDTMLSRPAPALMYRSLPIAYVWDDHDFGPNDADRTSPSREASVATYDAVVPAYPRVLPGPDGPIAQAFTIGRARFILADLRSQRDPQSSPDGPDKSMLGEAQREWFARELVEASRQHAVVFWVSSVPWIDPDSGGDDWGGYATERRWIADVIGENRLDNVVLLAGDAHMLGADDGTNSDYSSAGTGGFPVLQAGALDSRPSFKGGPYSEGDHPGAGQFGAVSVEDDGGDDVTVTFRGLRWDGSVVLRYRFTVPAG